jgi:hypothetical protein
MLTTLRSKQGKLSSCSLCSGLGPFLVQDYLSVFFLLGDPLGNHASGHKGRSTGGTTKDTGFDRIVYDV